MALSKSTRLVSILCLSLIIFASHQAASQRSLYHWKRDLEYRLTLYKNQHHIIDTIIDSSIYAPRQIHAGRELRISANGNVRFSDLIIPTGSLTLDSHIAMPTVRIMEAKTRDYVNTKRSELDQILNQLEQIQRQLSDPSRRYIYKGLRGVPQPPNSTMDTISGTRIFKQVHYAHVVESNLANLKQINYTNVDQVINETYQLNPQFDFFDSQNRLFFEGRKTFWDTVFTRPLKSGCCDRLKPLHTSRMMLRSVPQDVQSPVLLFSRNPTRNQQAVAVRQLTANQLINRPIIIDPQSMSMGLIPTPVSNLIQPSALINIRQPARQPEILKTIIFMNYLTIGKAQLLPSIVDNRPVIGILSMPGFQLDLTRENYLLNYQPSNNFSTQQVKGSLIIEGTTHIITGIDANSINNVANFKEFVQNALVSLNRPAVIKGSVHFNALPASLNGPEVAMSRTPSSVRIMHINQKLDVGLVNGMSWPQDIVVLPTGPQPNRNTLRPDDIIRVRGPRTFDNKLILRELTQVLGTVNGMQMPETVIPLHLNDFMSSVGFSNLYFADGISVNHMTVQSGQFDDITLRDVYGDAQSLIMRSVLATQPDGSQLIRAPLRIMNLNLLNRGLNQGLLNGFRPHEVLQLSKHRHESLYGPKTFMAPVEAIDCIFNDINQVANWTNHLIRTDRPDTIQTVQTKLAFSQFPNTSSSVDINRLKVDFYPDNSPVNHANNWHFSPEFYILHQALMRSLNNHTGGRYRVNHLRLLRPDGALVNGIDLNDIVTLDAPFRFADRFVMVGKVEVAGSLRASRIRSNYPIDSMDLVQFDKYRIPIVGSRTPIRLNNLVLGPGNSASFVQCHLLNGTPFNEFVNSIMSLTRPQTVYSNLVFNSPVDFEAMVRTESSLNGVKDFRGFASRLKNAKYYFEDGLQCNAVVIRS